MTFKRTTKQYREKYIQITKVWDEHFLYDKRFDGRHVNISIKGWIASLIIFVFGLK